ncbi:hypothetical protein BpHYR1_035892 [Brachionus plicatilis]|uniref:SWIM-type domain-containing protein n=1 Tax=Brachionus plicatilis TaxID=10195 RepID=A0A3M7Q739_BRAPC|nr:hypothetical protein BpHYR1_035892 [Brachionus plicatilis]
MSVTSRILEMENERDNEYDELIVGLEQMSNQTSIAKFSNLFRNGNSRCSCDWNSKNYICKHVIGVCSKLKIGDCQIHIASVNKPLGKKRSRGRPTLAAAAHIYSGRSYWIQKSLKAYLIR